MKNTTKKVSKSQQWYVDNPEYSYLKSGYIFSIEDIEYKIKRVSISKNRLEFCTISLDNKKEYYSQGNEIYFRLNDNNTITMWKYTTAVNKSNLSVYNLCRTTESIINTSVLL